LHSFFQENWRSVTSGAIVQGRVVQTANSFSVVALCLFSSGSRLKSENACYHSVQDILSFSLLSKNYKIKMNSTIIFSVFYGYETWSLTLREEHRLESVWE
jgi:hypothetical protein